MFEQVRQAIEGLRQVVAGLEPGCLTGEDAARLLERFAEAERLAAAGRTLLARRVEETRLWRREGHPSAAHYLAARTGTSVGAAVATLQTARRLDELPATGEALRAGKLSEVQAREIARAATAGCERRLLDAAGTCGVARLREQCHQAKAAGSAERDRDEAIRQSRYLRHWSGADGAFRLDLRTTAEAGATITAALAPLHQRLVREARAAGRADSEDALAADALVALAMTAGHGSGSSGPRAMVHVRVDADVLIRGYADGNETCEVPGVGPLSGASARALTQDAIVKAVITRGVDVVGVAHLGRTVTAAQRTALEERDATCVVQGCGVRHELEIDHVDGWVVTHTTTLARLARLCRWHHYLKTHCGYLLDGRPGQWRWLPPPDRT